MTAKKQSVTQSKTKAQRMEEIKRAIFLRAEYFRLKYLTDERKEDLDAYNRPSDFFSSDEYIKLYNRWMEQNSLHVTAYRDYSVYMSSQSFSINERQHIFSISDKEHDMWKAAHSIMLPVPEKEVSKNSD